MGKVKKSKIKDVGGSGPSTPDIYEIVPIGKKAVLIVYGAATPAQGDSDLYWGSDTGGWELVRSVSSGTYEYPRIFTEYVGDDVSRFKVENSNQGGAAKVRYWFEYILRDV